MLSAILVSVGIFLGVVATLAVVSMAIFKFVFSLWK